ncbi:unnamed protein product [Lampetra planeri]
MRSRLEAIAKQQGMGFHVTESTCYLTADLFYLEVLLLPCGEVDEVKVAPHGGSPVSSESFLKLLRSKQFTQFSVKLEGVFTQYNIPGDTEIQLKLFTSLQCLGKDLEEMSHLTSDLEMETINESRVGRLTAAKEDCPLNIQFYMVPTGPSEYSVQAAQVAVITTDVPHRLQMEPAIPLPLQLDPQGHPVFTPLTEMPHEMLPACFLLKLQPAVPMMMSFVNKIRQITGKGSSSISSDISSSTDHTPTKAPKNVAATEGLDSSTRTLSTPSPGLILPSKSSSLSSPALSSNGHETNSSSSSSSAHAETVAVVHPQPGAHPRSRPSKGHHHPPVDLLPDSALLQIFSHLPTNQLCRCARVCRRWYNVAWDPRLWGSVRLTGELLHADRAIRVLTHRLCQDTPNVCLTLETVVVNGCKRLTDRGLHVVAQCCPELRHLEVAGCYNISNDAVFEVVSRCPNLEHLNLSASPRRLRCSCRLSHGQQISIHYLDMTDCFSLEDEGLRTIASHCPRLTHLYCAPLHPTDGRGAAPPGAPLPVHPRAQFQRLSPGGGTSVLREVARLEGCLRYLSVAHCTRITDVGIRYVARYCPRLRYLNARGCEGLTDHGLGHLARSCPKLKSLDVGKCRWCRTAVWSSWRCTAKA